MMCVPKLYAMLHRQKVFVKQSKVYFFHKCYNISPIFFTCSSLRGHSETVHSLKIFIFLLLAKNILQGFGGLLYINIAIYIGNVIFESDCPTFPAQSLYPKDT